MLERCVLAIEDAFGSPVLTETEENSWKLHFDLSLCHHHIDRQIDNASTRQLNLPIPQKRKQSKFLGKTVEVLQTMFKVNDKVLCYHGPFLYEATVTSQIDNR